MKISNILETLEKNDWHWLGKVVKSPIFNRHSSVVKLFELMRADFMKYKKFNSSEKYTESLFPEAPENASKFHHVSNYLLNVLEDFMAWDNWNHSAPDKTENLLRACRKRGLHKNFRENLAKARESAVAQPLRDAAHYRHLYQLALEDYQYSLALGRSEAEQLQPLSDLHDIAFMAEKLKNACGIVSRQRVLNVSLETGLLQAVLEHIRNRPQLLEIPAIGLYYYGYLALVESKQDQHFDSLKKKIDHDAACFSLDELRDAYLLAINFCIHRINLREARYLQEIFDLYKNGLSAGVFLDSGQLSRFTYTNIALAGLRLKQYDWVYDFLNTYRNTLPEPQRAGAYAFNLARYYCEKGDYDQAMPLLLEMDFDDVLHNLTAKAMLARMYFETGEYDPLASLLASLSAYLRRKRQLSHQQLVAYQVFIHFTRRLISSQMRDARQRKNVETEIFNAPLVAEKEWLLKMVREMK